MDLIDDGPDGQDGRNTQEYSVSEVSGAVKKTLEDRFGRIRVRGEVGRVFKARSGHLYYDLKDDRNVLACTTWKGQVGSLSVVPEEGLEVVVTGRMTAFGGQSKYNLNVDEVTVAGQGALMALLEKRKTALAAEGLFDPARKQRLPFLPDVIGVVTSPSGAVIRDILHRLRERFPRRVLIWPVAVQGAACAPEVARAIRGFNALPAGGAIPRPDLLIVARGGGSIEDLWGFNEEAVVRAAAESRIPLISAVGHETDTTLIDHAADLRAPTPTAAAEQAVPVRLDLIAWVEGQGGRLHRAADGAVRRRRQRLSDLSRAFPRAGALLDGPRQRLDLAAEKLPGALLRGVQRRRLRLAERAGSLRPSVLVRMVAADRARFDRLAARLPGAARRASGGARDRLAARAARLSVDRIRRDLAQARRDFARLSDRLEDAGEARIQAGQARLAAAGRLLDTLGYEATLARGYAVVWSDGRVVTRRADAAAAQTLEVQFADGRLRVGPGTGRKSSKPTPKKGDQGTLF